MIKQPHSSEQIQHSVCKQQLLIWLAELLPEASILSEPEQLKPFECDALSAYTCLPWVVVLPDSITQIQHLMRLCQQHGIPVIARGAGTGLAGGALPLDNGVLLSLAKFNKIVNIGHP